MLARALDYCLRLHLCVWANGHVAATANALHKLVVTIHIGGTQVVRHPRQWGIYVLKLFVDAKFVTQLICSLTQIE